MTNKHITLEDINTWDYLFYNNYATIKIPEILTVGDETDFYKVLEIGGETEIELKINPFTRFFEEYNDYGVWGYWINEDNSVSMAVFRYNNKKTVSIDIEGRGETYLFLDNPHMELINNFPSAVLPKYFHYYMFEGDAGENRRFLLNTHLDADVLVNGKEHVQIEGDNKYLSLSMVLEDEKISIDVQGTESGIILKHLKKHLYEPPLIEIKDKFYIGCKNKISDVISSPITAKYYINNKEKEYILIPEDTRKDNQMVNVVTTSEFPYLPTDTYFQVPIEYYRTDNPRQLDFKEYVVCTMDFSGFNLVFDGTKHTIDMSTNEIRFSKIKTNVETMIKNADLKNNIFENNVQLNLLNCGNVENCKLINNGTLIIENTGIKCLNVINNGKLIIKNCYINLKQCIHDLPIIHNQGTVLMHDNRIINSNTYDNSSIIFIRGLENTNDLLNDNEWEYDECDYIEDGVFYTINGNGFVYSNIDDDSIILKNLVISDVQ